MEPLATSLAEHSPVPDTSPMAEGTRAAASARRRTAILAAALECFASNGVAATTIEDLRQRSGASIGSIYHHFGSKEEVAVALYLEAMEDYQRGLLATLAEHADTRAGIEAGVRHHIGWVVAHPDHARFLFAGLDARVALVGQSDLRQLNRRFFKAVMDWLGPRQRRGELREAPAHVLHALWVGPSQELCRHWLVDRIRDSPVDAAPVLAAAAWNALNKE